MTVPITVLDEDTLRRILGEELDARLDRIRAATVPATANDAPGLLTREQLAERLQLDVRTLRRLEREGAVPRPVRIGDRIARWRRADIDTWLESGAPPLPQRKRAGSVSTHGDRRS